VLRWEERDEPEHAQMYAWYRSLIAARKDHFELRDPRPTATRVERDGDVLTIHRGELALVCNFANEPRRANLGQVITASTGLANSRELPPTSCLLTRSVPREPAELRDLRRSG
jgi:hypothetical protein